MVNPSKYAEARRARISERRRSRPAPFANRKTYIGYSGDVAPQVNSVIYCSPNTDARLADAFAIAIDDVTNKLSIVAISWGRTESNGPERKP